MQENKNNKKIACTGAAGFIGSNFIEYLNKQGYNNIDVYEKLDCLHNKWQNLAGLEFNNILDYNLLLREDVINNYDWICILGANSSTRTSKEEYQQTLFDNVEYPNTIINLFTSQLQFNPNRKLIFASSAATYGLSENFKERTSDIKPSNFYGLTKLMVDRNIERNIEILKSVEPVYSVNKRSDIHSSLYSFRFFNVFGKREEHKAEANMTSPVSRFLAQEPPFILFNSADPKYKTDEMSRDFIAVEDICSTLFWALTNKVPNGIFNLGSGVATTWKELLEIVCELKGYNFNEVVKYIDMPEEIKQHYQYYTKANIAKLRAAGYKKDFINIKDAVKKLVEN